MRLVDCHSPVKDTGATVAEAKVIREFTWMPQLAYRAAASTGNGWAMLPSAAAFIDPLFPTGFPLTLLGIERLGRMLEEDRFNQAEVRKEYNEVTKGIAWLPPWRSGREFSLGPLSVILPFDSRIFRFSHSFHTGVTFFVSSLGEDGES